MYNSLRLAFLVLMFVYVKAQHRRNKIINTFPYPMDEKVLDENLPCAISACMKRSAGQDELGPFWANRGKRNPNYIQSRLYVEEPYWVVIRKDDSRDLEEPFFTSRGKKDVDDIQPFRNINLRFRDRREFPVVVESPFFAARGKKIKAKHEGL